MVWCKVTYAFNQPQYGDTKFVTTVNVAFEEGKSTPQDLFYAIKNGKVADRWKYLTELISKKEIKIIEVEELLKV